MSRRRRHGVGGEVGEEKGRAEGEARSEREMAGIDGGARDRARVWELRGWEEEDGHRKKREEKERRKKKKGPRDLKENPKDRFARREDRFTKTKKKRRVAARGRGWEGKTARGRIRVWRQGGPGPVGLLSRHSKLLFSFAKQFWQIILENGDKRLGKTFPKI